MKKFFSIFNTIYLNYVILFISLNCLIVLLYIFNLNQLVIDMALFGSFVTLLCQLFSANSRTLLLSDGKISNINNAIIQRLLFSVPIIFFSSTFVFIYNISDYSLAFSILFLILLNWIYELVLTKKELKSNNTNHLHAIYSICLFILSIYSLFLDNIIFFKLIINLYIFLIFFEICRFFLRNKIQIKINFIELKNIFQKFYLSSLISSISFSVSNFLFRYFVIKLTSLDISSALIIGFMFGSFPVSLFFHIFGASIIRNNFSFIDTKKILVYFVFAILILITGYIIFLSEFSHSYSQNIVFITSFYSILGIIPMLLGLYQRQKFIQKTSLIENFFYLDIIYSLSVITIVPLIYMSGFEYLFTTCFLFSGIFSYIIFNLSSIFKKEKLIKIFLFILILPIFIDFFSPLENFETFFSSSRLLIGLENLFILPIPVSMLILIFLTLGLLRFSKIKLISVYAIILSFFISIFAITYSERLTFSNFLNICQFYIPMIAIIAGEITGKLKKFRGYFINNFFIVSFFFIFIQVIISLFSQNLSLSPNILGIKIYQYSDYTNVIFFIGFMMYLYKENLPNLRLSLANALFLIMLIYYFNLSTSIEMFFFVFVSSVLIILCKQKIYLPLILLSLFSFNAFVLMDFSLFIQDELSKRIYSQMIFFSEVTTNWLGFFLGSNINNEVYSISNGIFIYYLDFIYNFGFIALVPIIYLLFIVFYSSLKNQKVLFKKNENLILFIILTFSFLIESFMGVSLKQPFIGIIYYFIFGLYISKLSFKNDY